MSKTSEYKAQILCCGITAYSRREDEQQEKVICMLNKIILDCVDECIPHYESNNVKIKELLKSKDPKIVFCPSGDGMAVVYQSKDYSGFTLEFGKTILEKIDKYNKKNNCKIFERENWCNCHSSFLLSIGISLGPIIYYNDISGLINNDDRNRRNVAGDAINHAARVMDIADPMQIIITESTYSKFNNKILDTGTMWNSSEWMQLDIEHLVKCRELQHAYLYTPAGVSYINKKMPTKLKKPVELERVSKAWMEINQSYPEVEMCLLKNEDKPIRECIVRFISENYPIICKRKDNIVGIRKVDEKTGETDNYRIAMNDGNVFLFRYHKNKNKTSEDIERTQRIKRYVVGKDIFEPDYNKGINPIPLKGYKTLDIGKDITFTNLDYGVKELNGYVELSWFIDGCSHYSGRNDELKSFALFFGKLQNAICKANRENLLIKGNPETGYLQYINGKEYVEIIERSNDDANQNLKYGSGSAIELEIDMLLCAYKEVIDEAIKACNDNICREKDERLKLIECHPLNTFFKEGECKLIYDYETVSSATTLEESIALTAHRFIREAYRKREEEGVEMSKLIKEFYNGYKEYGPLPNDNDINGLIERLPYQIKMVSLFKIANNLRINEQCKQEKDNELGRSPETIRNEVTKFITFLIEADSFIV